MTCLMTCLAQCLSAAPCGLSAPTASLSTAAGQRGRDLLVAQPSSCHFFDGKEFLCGEDHLGSENTYKHLCFEATVAVVRGCGVSCVGVLSEHFLFWAPLLRTGDTFSTYPMPKRHRENRWPSRPPCIINQACPCFSFSHMFKAVPASGTQNEQFFENVSYYVFS